MTDATRMVTSLHPFTHTSPRTRLQTSCFRTTNTDKRSKYVPREMREREMMAKELNYRTSTGRNIADVFYRKILN